ncbi:hypothetical protein [Paraglaciecola sp.]|uniref:hypothetical protein n=1 Tax=Paraglaciecola sp. TaxID=1920173 RepID=UPI003EF64403
MIAQKINEKIKSIESVSTATSNNIFLGEQPENTAKPFIVYAFSDSTPINTLQGASNLKNEVWSVKLTGNNYASLDEMKETIITEFTSERANFTASLDDINVEKDRAADLDHITLFFRLHFY